MTETRPESTAVLIATRKGAFMAVGDTRRQNWQLEGPHFLGAVVNHIVLDPRDRQTILMAASAGHLGPTIYRSRDYGKSWQEALIPPAFPKELAHSLGSGVNQTYYLEPGHSEEPNVWYAGTSPAGLFRSEDGGLTWQSVDGFNTNPMRTTWTGPRRDQPPGGGEVHSIQIDPRSANHLYIGVSLGGIFESTDRGKTWQPLNEGLAADHLPDPQARYGHDPHSLRLHPREPDVLYQQNHFGVYRMDRRSGDRWQRIGLNLPSEIGDYGFPIAIHPQDTRQAWVFPIDSTGLWPRVSPGGKPAVYHTADSGKSWQRQDAGLPQEHAYFTVRRQALTQDGLDPIGVYFGTTGGEVWYSRTGGESWQLMAAHLPEILALEVTPWPIWK